MTYDLIAALIAFSFATSVTPGPNNLMLMASGVNFGFTRTLPHMLGVALGFSLMVLLVGLGLAGLFKTEPRAVLALKLVSVAYMLWLAWKIAHSAPPRDGQAGGKPLSFLQAAAFQWVNPKAWAMALTATSVYAPDQSVVAMASVAAIFGAVNLPSVAIWVAAGQGLRRFLTNPRWRHLFNWTMAALLVLSLWPVLDL
ncbi:MAG: threonine/homoserine/homoserine lactone efflux protein [Pseudorhodobacter sp.]|jgi:threonine/homoserine/homoserine lactone efflux protein